MLVCVSSSWHVLEKKKIMYNNQQNSDHHKGAPPMSPRISFSNDFVDSSSSSHSHSHSHSHAHMRAGGAYRDAPVSSDFEFSVSNYSMMSADELFFKGRLLPFKENCRKTTTLRDELQNEDVESSEDFSLRPPKNPRWRGFLGLRKSHIGSKRSDKGESSSRQSFHHDDAQSNKNSQDSGE